MSERVDVLNEAAELTGGDRNEAYGDPTEQMECTEDLFQAYMQEAEEKYPVGHDAAIFLALNKISRIACGQHKRDNYVDAAAYLAIAQEVVAVKGMPKVEDDS